MADFLDNRFNPCFRLGAPWTSRKCRWIDPLHNKSACLRLLCMLRAMELRSLHYFVRIAELGSITRAAAHLHLAQPALTRHVQRLEEELGVALFTRANRGVRLTEAGQKLLDSATRILRDVERTGDEIRAQDAQ